MKACCIARDNQIPKSYLDQILNKLRRADLVSTARGPQGGYYLAKSPSEITVGDIVRALEGQLEPVLCSYPEIRSSECREEAGCASQTFCKAIEVNLEKLLNGTTVADLLLISQTPNQPSLPSQLDLGTSSTMTKPE